MKKTNLLLIISIIFISVQYPGDTTAQHEQARIREDIEIMEVILNQLFNKTTGDLQFFHGGGTRGYYLENYGVLFEISYTMHQTHLNATSFHAKNEDFFIHRKPENKRNRLINKELENNSQKARKEKIEKVKEKLIRFLGDYASAISGLNADHWITIVVDLDDTYLWTELLRQQRPVQKFLAKVQYKDIINLRKDKISLAEFKKRINFEQKTENATHLDEDIDIFSNIIESTLRTKNNDLEYQLSDHVKGFYLDGYGVIFMLNAFIEPGMMRIFSHENKNGKEQNYSFQTFISSDRQPVDIEKRIATIENQVINAMSRFGHTMRKLENNDWLEIAIKVDGPHLETDFSKITFRIKKQDIDRFNQQKINQTDFRKRVKVVKY